MQWETTGAKWLLIGGLASVLLLAGYATLRIYGGRSAIPKADPQKAERMMQVCILPRTLHTKEQLAVVHMRDSGGESPVSGTRRIPVLDEPYTPLVEVEAAIGRADAVDGEWMEWKENPGDAAGKNWYMRLAFDADKKLKTIVSRNTAKSGECKEVRVGRAVGDWYELTKSAAECGLDCR